MAASRLVALAAACVVSLLGGSTTVSPQATIDSENRYSNVGALMVWRVTPLEIPSSCADSRAAR